MKYKVSVGVKSRLFSSTFCNILFVSLKIVTNSARYHYNKIPSEVKNPLMRYKVGSQGLTYDAMVVLISQQKHWNYWG